MTLFHVAVGYLIAAHFDLVPTSVFEFVEWPLDDAVFHVTWITLALYFADSMFAGMLQGLMKKLRRK